MKIIEYDDKYRDDMIFMVLEAKNALGRIPRINDDLLDVYYHYIANGEMFWLALDGSDRVIGCVGFNKENNEVAKLHRLYVKHDRKRQGIGTALLRTAQTYMKAHGIKTVIVHLGGEEYFESRSFYNKHGYTEYAPSMIKKEL